MSQSSSDLSVPPSQLTLEEAVVKHDIEALRAEIAELKRGAKKNEPQKKAHEKRKVDNISSSDSDEESTKSSVSTKSDKTSAEGKKRKTDKSLSPIAVKTSADIKPNKAKKRRSSDKTKNRVVSKVVKHHGVSPKVRGKTKHTFGTKTTALQCKEGKPKPTIRLNVGKPSVARPGGDRVNEERSSLDDFELPAKRATVASKRKPTSTATATIVRPQPAAPYRGDISMAPDLDDDDENKMLSVTILDAELNIVRCADGGKKLLKDVPIYHRVSDALDYVALHYFYPPLLDLQPYAYAGRIGTGKPHPIRHDTTMTEIKLSQKHRRVGMDRLSIVGKSHLTQAEVIDQFKNNQMNMMASTEALKAPPTAQSRAADSSDEKEYASEDNWYDDAYIANDDDTILAGNLTVSDTTMSPTKHLSSPVAPDQEVFKSVSDVINHKDELDPLQPLKPASSQTAALASGPAPSKEAQIDLELVRKTYALCKEMDDKLDTLDYVTGNQDALARSVEKLIDSNRQVKLDIRSMKSDIADLKVSEATTGVASAGVTVDVGTSPDKPDGESLITRDSSTQTENSDIAVVAGENTASPTPKEGQPKKKTKATKGVAKGTAGVHTRLADKKESPNKAKGGKRGRRSRQKPKRLMEVE